MEKFIEEKTNEMDQWVGVLSFKKGSDNYNKLREIIIEAYNKGVDDTHFKFKFMAENDGLVDRD